MIHAGYLSDLRIPAVLTYQSGSRIYEVGRTEEKIDYRVVFGPVKVESPGPWPIQTFPC